MSYSDTNYATALKLAQEKVRSPQRQSEAGTNLHEIAVYLHRQAIRDVELLERVLNEINDSWPITSRAENSEIRKIAAQKPMSQAEFKQVQSEVLSPSDVASERLIAEMIASQGDLNKKVHFVSDEDKPRAWNGYCWENDYTHVSKVVMDAVHVAVIKLCDKGKLEFKQAGRLESKVSMSAVQALLKSFAQLVFQRSELDPPYLLSCLNGVLDLRTGQLLPHDPARPITKCTNTKYLTATNSNEWNLIERHLESIGLEEAAIIRRYIGASAIGMPADRKILWLRGEGGDGKSTLLRAIAGALGTYAGTVPAEAIAVKGGGGAHGNELLSPLMHARMVEVSEVPSDVNWPLLKALSGGDSRTTKRMHGKATTHTANSHLVILSNEKPIVPYGDNAARERLVLMNWHKPTEPDPDLVRVLVTGSPGRTALFEACLSWIVLGAADFQREGYGIKEPTPIDYEAPEGLAAWWHAGSDAGWLISGAKWTTASEAEEQVNQWSLDHGIEPFSKTAIGTFLKTKVRSMKKPMNHGRCMHYYLEIGQSVRSPNSLFYMREGRRFILGRSADRAIVMGSIKRIVTHDFRLMKKE